jgi:hypothetical protein
MDVYNSDFDEVSVLQLSTLYFQTASTVGMVMNETAYFQPLHYFSFESASSLVSFNNSD